MLAAARGKGRVAYVLEPDFSQVQAELAAGTPVLVLQDLGALGIRRWHFAVVIGYDPERDVVILRSGTRRRHVAAPRPISSAPGRPAATGPRWSRRRTGRPRPPRAAASSAPSPTRSAVSRGRPSRRATRRRWRAGPADPLVLLANGNDAYANQRLADAIRLYRELLAIDPGNVAGRNNLANALLDAGCPQAALAEARAGRGATRRPARRSRRRSGTRWRKLRRQPRGDDSLCRAE